MTYFTNNKNNNRILFFLYLIFIINISEAQTVPAIYVFGDSLVDVGNNNHLQFSLAKANFYPNGVDFQPRKATGRFSNGKNSADFLAEKVGLPTSPPYLSLISNSKNINSSSFIGGVSFASGGAGIFNGTDDTFKQSIPLIKQVEYYSKVHEKILGILGQSGTEIHLSNSLFAIVIGSNDLFDYFGSSSTRRSQIAPQQFVDQMLVTLREQIKKLYTYGARKLVVIGVGALGCCPAQRRKNNMGECFEETNRWTVEYNHGLKSTLQELKSELNGFNYSYFETYNVLLKLIQTPTSYGFSEAKAACCGFGKLKAETPCLPISLYCSNRSDHIFWDRYHPSEAASRILVDFLFNGPLDYSFPMNVKQLIMSN